MATLYYFGIMARGEPIRLAFHYGGIKFEDRRFTGAEWASEYKAKSPTGRCPYLELADGKTICESLACLVYAGTLSGLVPRDPLEVAAVFQIVCYIEDIWVCVSRVVSSPKEEMASAMNEFKVSKLPGMIEILDKLVAVHQNSEGYVVGGKPSIADLCIYSLVKSATSLINYEIQTPSLKACENAVAALPQIQSYLL